MTRVGVLAYEGVDELDLVGVFAPLVKAAQCARHPAGLEVVLIANKRSFHGANGLQLGRAAGLDRLAGCDALVVPGGRGAERAAASPQLLAAVSQASERGAAMFSICTGALVVAAAGVRPRRLAVHQNKGDQLRRLTSAEITQGLTRDPKVVSIGGRPCRGLKSVDIAFEVLARFAPACLPCVAARLELPVDSRWTCP